MKAAIRRAMYHLRATISDPMTLRGVTIRLRARKSSGAKRLTIRRPRARFAELIPRRRATVRRREASSGRHRHSRRATVRRREASSGRHRRRLKAPRRARRIGLHHLLRRRNDLRRLLPPAKALLHARRNSRLTVQRLRVDLALYSGLREIARRDCSPNRRGQPMMAGLFGCAENCPQQYRARKQAAACRVNRLLRARYRINLAWFVSISPSTGQKAPLL